MKGHHLACAAILVLMTSSTWAQNTGPKISYSDKEYTGLLRCHGMTDIAWTNAVQELNG